jgi:hypothetical protein
MSAADAMQQYIETLTNVDPDWQSAEAAAATGSREPQQKQGGAGGPVFSTLRDPHAEQQEVGCTVCAVSTITRLGLHLQVVFLEGGGGVGRLAPTASTSPRVCAVSTLDV